MFDPNILMKTMQTCRNRYFSIFIKTWTIRWHCSFLVLNLNGFIGQHAVFLSHPKAKITKFGDRQASKNSVRTKYFFVRCTWATNLEPWAPQLECLGAQRVPQKFSSGNQIWGLGALAKMLGSPKGSLKFSLEHSTAFLPLICNRWLVENILVWVKRPHNFKYGTRLSAVYAKWHWSIWYQIVSVSWLSSKKNITLCLAMNARPILQPKHWILHQLLRYSC